VVEFHKDFIPHLSLYGFVNAIPRTKTSHRNFLYFTTPTILYKSLTSLRNVPPTAFIPLRFRYFLSKLFLTYPCFADYGLLDLTQVAAAGITSQRPVFASGSVHVRYVVGEVALGQASLPVLRVSPVNIIPPWLSTLLYHLGITISPLVAAVQRHNFIPSTLITTWPSAMWRRVVCTRSSTFQGNLLSPASTPNRLLHDVTTGRPEPASAPPENLRPAVYGSFHNVRHHVSRRYKINFYKITVLYVTVFDWRITTVSKSNKKHNDIS
jgi:hypothetical protein